MMPDFIRDRDTRRMDGRDVPTRRTKTQERVGKQACVLVPLSHCYLGRPKQGPLYHEPPLFTPHARTAS